MAHPLARPSILAALMSVPLAVAAPLGGLRAETTAPTVETVETVAPERLAALSHLMMMPEVFAVMAEEGRVYGASIEDQMFPGRGGPAWAMRVETIYAPDTLLPMFETAFAAALAQDPDTVAAAEAFFGTPAGQEILKLEIEARRALLDTAVEEAAQVEAERMKTERDPRLRLVRDLIEAGDLIESNVAGALSANLAFFEGMAAANVPGMMTDRESMMAEVWSQEDSIRAEMANWLVPFLCLAYQPVSETDLKTYIAFSASSEGKRLNAALFAGFNETSRRISLQLGRAAAEAMAGNDI